MGLTSNCCGAKVAYEDFDKGTGLCCDCKEWCEFLVEDTVCKKCKGKGCEACDARKLPPPANHNQSAS